MTGQKDLDLQGDRPLLPTGVDYLNFEPLAREVAKALAIRSAKSGMVIGLEGKWGSGKSSLINFIQSEMNSTAPEAIIFKFQPWLIGDRDALISAYFDELAKALASHKAKNGDATDVSLAAASDLAEKVRRYAGYVGSLAPATALLSVLDVPGSTIATKFLRKLRDFREESVLEKKPLQDLKSEIENDLLKLNAQIVVVIDDVDRLEPDEISELLRLIRSVADFPKVTYLLCFDPEVVSEAIENTLRLQDGLKYLEKIFQITVKLPAPEPFALKRMFEDGLSSIIGLEDQKEQDELALLIDTKGGKWLDTPRAVNRTLDAIRFIYPSVRGKVNVSDLVWITLVRMNDPKLHDWIETYLGSMAAMSSGRVHISEENATLAYKRLRDILKADPDRNVESALLDLAKTLPGFDTFNFSRNDTVPIFKPLSNREKSRLRETKRLGSPDHYRLYFAMVQPTASPSERDFEEFLSAAQSQEEELRNLIISLSREKLDYAGSKLAVILDQIDDETMENLPHHFLGSIIYVFSDVLDDPQVVSDFGGFLSPQLWRQSRIFLSRAKNIPDFEFFDVMEQAFKTGKAIAWLTSVLRRETFAHGRFGDQELPESEWLFSENEYDKIASIMIKRLDEAGVDGILSHPNSMSTLFGWLQASQDPEHVRNAVSDFTAHDENFLLFLHNAASTTRSTEGNYQAIRPSTINPFYDYDEAKRRLRKIEAENPDLAADARGILLMFKPDL